MTVKRDVRLSAPQGLEVEEKIRAAGAWNDFLVENAKRVEMYSYGQSKEVLKKCPIRDRSFLYGLRTSWFLNAD